LRTLALLYTGTAAVEPRFQVTLAVDIDSIAAGSAARVAFETDFVRDMAAALGVEESDVRIIEITAGSVAVMFEVAATEGLDVADVLSSTQPTIAGADFEFVAEVSHSAEAPPPPASGGVASISSDETAATANAAALSTPSVAGAVIALAMSVGAVAHL
jgi:hypothetical protein